MTSGQFAQFPVDQIFVNRPERQRKELVGVEELAASIQRIGLIHPPVIERTGELRVGERRWNAVKLLGWTHVPVQFVDELAEDELQLLELEENLRRENLTWQDECAAVLKYHRIREAEEPGWQIAQTAERLGMSRQFAGERIRVAEEIERGNTRVKEAPKFSVARNVVQRVAERAAANAVTTAKLTLNIPSARAEEEKAPPLELVDFNDWSKYYDGPTFNMIHCDFPYGIKADKHDQGQAALAGGYADTFDVYDTLLWSLRRSMKRIIAESAHLIFWFSMDYYQFTFDKLTDMGWKVNPFPLVWFKSDNTGILPDPQRGPRRVYETAFFASRGDRKLTANGAVANTFAWPGSDKTIHMSEKPIKMLQHFMRMTVDEHSRVLDPTCGSANALKAATKLGAELVLGLERDEEFYNRAREAYFNDD